MRRPWEKHKAEMVRLYIDESKKLDDVMKIMLDRFNFRASKRAYRFHFDHWGIEKYNCKKRNERKIRRQQHLPSPAMTSSPPQCSSMPSSRDSRQGYGNDTFDFSQPQDYFHHDSFVAQSVPHHTGLAFPELSYSSALNDAPTQALSTSSMVMLGHRPPPTPEPEGVPQFEEMSPNHGMAPLGCKSPFETPAHFPLLDAIRRQDPQQVQELIRYGVRLDVPDDHGSYPIHHAVALSEPRITRILLEAGVDDNVVDRYGRTPLFLATTISALKMLMEREYPPNLCHRDHYGDTVLHSLFQVPSWHTDPFRREATTYFLSNMRVPAATLLNTPNSRGLTPFQLAVSSSSTGSGFTPALIEPLARMLAWNPNVTTPMPGNHLPLSVFVESFLKAQASTQDPLTSGEWDTLHALLLRFLDLSPPRMYPVRVLRAFLLSPSLLFHSVCHLWDFLQRLVRRGVIDVSAPDGQGCTALLDVVKVGHAAVAARGPVVEERVTALVKGLIAGTSREALGMMDGQGRSVWDVYARGWARGHREFAEIMRMFAAKRPEIFGPVKREIFDGAQTREMGDEWGGELKVSRVVEWRGGRPRMSCVMGGVDQGLLTGNKSAVKQEY